MSEYNAHSVSITVAQRARDVEAAARVLGDLAEKLEVDAEGTYDDYWAQHAEDYLTHQAEALEAQATLLRYLAGRYTLTGMHRPEAAAR
jgi:hypothetical protein